MEAALHLRDRGLAQRAVLEVKHAMLERQLADLARARAALAENEVAAGPAAGPNLASASTSTSGRKTTSRGLRGDVHVVYRDNQWHVEIDGHEHQVDSSHRFRIAAVVVAHETARTVGRDLVIHGRDGSVRERVSYRTDPPRDRVRYKRRPELRRA
ncbi:MAG: DUF2188 domain-containing protein [Burkholderiales bacterium]